MEVRRSGRKIGDLLIHELPNHALDTALKGANFVVKGEIDLRDGFACQMVANHATNANPMARVRDVVSETTLKRIEKKAANKARQFVAQVRQMPREVLEHVGSASS